MRDTLLIICFIKNQTAGIWRRKKSSLRTSRWGDGAFPGPGPGRDQLQGPRRRHPGSTQLSPSFHPAFNQLSANFQPAFNQRSTSFQPAFTQLSTSFQPAFTQLSPSFSPALTRLSSRFHPSFTQLSVRFQPAFNPLSPNKKYIWSLKIILQERKDKIIKA